MVVSNEDIPINFYVVINPTLRDPFIHYIRERVSIRMVYLKIDQIKKYYYIFGYQDLDFAQHELMIAVMSA